MKVTIDIFTTIIYILVGLICLLMAYKSLFSGKYLAFHEEAAGKAWESIDKALQKVIITILRVSGLGFLIVFLLLTLFPIVNYFKQDLFIKLAIPIIAIVFCFGLFLFNLNLYKQTNAKTPWSSSLIALSILVVNLILSIIF